MTAVTPAEAKAVWDSIDKPSSRKVADKLAAAGRKVSFKTIAKWKREGWPSVPPEDTVEKKAEALLSQAAPAVTGDPTSTAADIVTLEENPGGQTPNSLLAERALRRLIVGSEVITAALVRKADLLVMAGPESTAKSLVAVSLALKTATDGLAHVTTLRGAEMKDTPGAVEILPPAESHPLHASVGYLESALKTIDVT